MAHTVALCLFIVLIVHTQQRIETQDFSLLTFEAPDPKVSQVIKKKPKPSPDARIVSQSLNNTCSAYKKSNNNFCETEQGFALHTRTLKHTERIW